MGIEIVSEVEEKKLLQYSLIYLYKNLTLQEFEQLCKKLLGFKNNEVRGLVLRSISNIGDIYFLPLVNFYIEKEDDEILKNYAKGVIKLLEQKL